MRDGRANLVAVTGLSIITALGLIRLSSGTHMQEIKFTLGKDIISTAEASGVPRFATRNIDGLISYSVAPVPSNIPVYYTKPGYEIVWEPIFAFTMYADESRSANRMVQLVDLQLNKNFQTDAEAQAFVEQTITQFRKGKWQRYYEPTWDALLTGRSSFLDVNGKLESSPMAIDPDYKIEPADWLTLVDRSANWSWVGDGVLAKLSVSADHRIGARSPTYRVNLEFNFLDIKLKQDQENEAEEFKKGDAKGWNSTANNEKNKIKQLAILKVMEANALKRGDRVLAPH